MTTDAPQSFESDDLKQLVQQAQQMQTAYGVIQAMYGALSVESITEGIVKSLVEIAGLGGAEIALEATFDDVRLHSVAQAGEAIGRCYRVAVVARAVEVGSLAVHYDADQNENEIVDLLDYVMPTISISIDNAISFLEVMDYRRTLEQKVADRTAELAEAHAQLARSHEDLGEAKAARDRFFGNVSHEFRTPLSLITLAAADVEARAGATLDTRARQSLGSVGDGARKLLRLVDELLMLAAGQEGKFAVHREPTDLAGLLTQLVAAWRPAAEAAGLELSGTMPPSLVTSIDPVAIERVASNLISNAVKYTPRGGRIEIELAETDELRLSVLDTGRGIDSELAGRLFGRFERGTRDLQTKGTGIGLSIVKQLVEAHGGTIAALPRTTGGTEIRVMLPRTEVRDAAPAVRGLRLDVAAPSAAALVSGTRYEPSTTSLGTIVVAEDDPGLADSVARLLADKYMVIVGLDGEAALALVKQHEPQLLITDIDMPRMNGIELARAFREQAGDKLAPIIILSAVIDLGTRVAGLEAGAIDYVTKPFDPRELLARVDAQFRMRDLAVRLRQAEQLSTLGILTSGLAHELRNPANGIVNAIAPLTELLPAELIGPETGPGQLIEVIGSCASQISFLSRQLLGFRGETQLELRPARLSERVERAVAMASSASRDVEVRTKLGPDREIQCSPPLILQALTNLIENGCHAAGPKGWVEVTTWTEGGSVVVEVADSGPGVPVGLRDRIFEPFFTTKAPGSGTGLGLPFARAIMHRHGGTLQIRERQGRPGFVLELPAERLATTRAIRHGESNLAT